MFYIGLFRENIEYLLSLTAKIFGIQHHLVDFYKVCSIYTLVYISQQGHGWLN